MYHLNMFFVLLGVSNSCLYTFHLLLVLLMRVKNTFDMFDVSFSFLSNIKFMLLPLFANSFKPTQAHHIHTILLVAPTKVALTTAITR